MTMQTRTGNFPIGFLRGGSEWQKDLAGLINWTKQNGLAGIDVGADVEAGKQITDAGLRVGTVSLNHNVKGMISPDNAKRDATIAEFTALIEAGTKLGLLNYFLVMLPEKPELPRAENFGYMVDSFTALVPTLEKNNAHIVIEGWPGPGALCCTPEGYRAFFEKVPSKAMGVNYDPSHLIRMGIDHLRFLREFAGRVYHVHGKDTELSSEGLYEYGHEQPATFGKAPAFGGMAWRYTIPGHGQARWIEVMRILKGAGYQGMVSIELEDANFNGTTEGEKLGILQGARFLEGV